MKHETLVPDDLWEAVEPFLPEEPPKPKGGRPRVSDRAALAGIVFVLRTGVAWQMLPTELGCGSGSTCWRRLRVRGACASAIARFYAVRGPGIASGLSYRAGFLRFGS